MDQINQNTFNNRFSLEFLPTEMLFGIKTVNCEVKCEDEIYRPVIGIELGFIFFDVKTFSYLKNRQCGHVIVALHNYLV